MTRLIATLACTVVLAASVAAQDPPTTLRIGSRVGTSEAVAAPASGYQEIGRRDPFAPLVNPPSAAAPATAAPEKRAPGLAGHAIADLDLKGIISSGQTRIALLAAPDGKTYMARAQDRLHDGVVRRIDADAVVMLQNASMFEGAREVRKVLRPAAGGGHP